MAKPRYGVIQLVTVFDDGSKSVRAWTVAHRVVRRLDPQLLRQLGEPTNDAFYAAEAVRTLTATAEETSGIVVLGHEGAGTEDDAGEPS